MNKKSPTKSEILKDYREDISELYNPYFWQNGKIIVSVLMEPYWLDKVNNLSMKEYKNSGSRDFDLFGFAYENNAKVVMRITTPTESKEIAFPFITFVSIYLNADKAVKIFKRAAINYLNSIGYKNVSIKEGSREKLIKTLSKAIKNKK